MRSCACGADEQRVTTSFCTRLGARTDVSAWAPVHPPISPRRFGRCRPAKTGIAAVPTRVRPCRRAIRRATPRGARWTRRSVCTRRGRPPRRSQPASRRRSRARRLPFLRCPRSWLRPGLPMAFAASASPPQTPPAIARALIARSWSTPDPPSSRAHRLSDRTRVGSFVRVTVALDEVATARGLPESNSPDTCPGAVCLCLRGSTGRSALAIVGA